MTINNQQSTIENPRLLIIDDDRNLCESLKDVLELQGYLAESVYTAEDGIKKVREGFYNIILLDMRLPNSHGMEVLDEIKKISPDTEVIIFTAFAETQDVIEAMERNAFSYLPKPFETSKLLETIKRACEKQRLLFENRRMFEQISQAKKDWENTFDSISDLISIHDENFNIIKCNKAFSLKFNARPEDIIGQKCYQVFHGSDKPFPACPLNRCRETLNPETEEMDEPHMGGIFQILAFPRYDSEGRFIGCVEICRDITEQKEIEKQQKVLKEVSDVLSKTSNLETVSEAIFNSLGQIIPLQYMVIISYDSATEILQSIAVKSMSESTGIKEGMKASLKDNPVYLAYRKRDMVYRSYEEIQKSKLRFDIEIVQKYGIKSDLIIPLIRSNDVIGFLIIACSSVDIPFFEEGKRVFFQKISEILSGWLSNTLLIEKTRKSELKYRTLFELVTDGIVFTDLKGSIIDCNQEFLNMLGYTLEEIKTKTFRDITPSKWHSMEERIIREQIKKRGYSVLYEKEYIRKDSTVFPISIIAWLNKDEEGKVNGMWGIARDITEQKKAEVKVTQQNEILNAINEMFKGALTCETEEAVGNKYLSMAEKLTGSKFGFIGELNQETGLFDTIVLSNPGWDACNIPKTNAVKLIKDMKIRGIDRSVLKEEKSRIVNDPASHPDWVGMPKGHPPITSFLGVPLIHDGRTFGMISLGNKESGYDLEDQKAVETLSAAFVEAITRVRIESALRDNEEKFRTISNTAHEGIIMVDNAGYISFWNNAAERIFGYSIEEAMERPVHKLIIPHRFHKDHLKGFRGFWDTGVGTVIGNTIELTAMKKDGTEFPIELSLSSTKNKDTWHEVAIIRDITARKNMEERVRISSKMASLGSLTAGVFHEVLNPLQIISSYTQLLLLKEEKGSEKESYLQKILHEVDRIVKITNNLLKFSRKGNLGVEEVDLNSLLENVIEIVKHEIKLNNIECITRIEDGIPEILANNDELRQVFLNLINNAKDAMPEGGNLTISTQRIVKQGRPFASIRFKDTGCGIKSDDIDKIFDPFYTTKPEGKGTGLGLSISYGIIKSYGGEMSVNSKEGKGATFIIDLAC